MVGLTDAQRNDLNVIDLFRSAESVLLARSEIAARNGSTFGGLRNVSETLGYKANLTPTDFWQRFKRNGIARRLVKAYPDATWRGQGELIEDEDPQVLTEFESSWFALDQKHHLWQAFHKADILSGIGNFGAVLLGSIGDTSSELTRGVPLLFVTPLGQLQIVIKEYETDITNERYGLPKFYTITGSAPNSMDSASNRTAAMDVHWTRIIHLAEGLESKVLGPPRLEAVWNDFDDLEKVKGAGSEAFWQRANRGMAYKLDPTVPMDEGEMEKWKDEIDNYEHKLRRHMRLRGVEVQEFGSDVATFDKNVSSIISLIAAGSEIPQRILLGSERGELASTSDQDNWSERVADRRTEWAGPSVVHQFVQRAQLCGWLPELEMYETRWPAMHEFSDEQKAKYATQLAEVNQKNNSTVFSSDEIRDWAFGAEPLEAVQVEDRPRAATRSKYLTWRTSKNKRTKNAKTA